LNINFVSLIESVTDAKPALRESITQPLPDILKLLRTPACSRCVEFLAEESSSRDETETLHRGACLLLTLAVYQTPSTYSQKEGLCLFGLRGVDVFEAGRTDRREMAALARKKPLHDTDWYVKRHLPRTQARIAGELRALVEYPQLLEEALARDGKTIIMRHL
jgi:hypothetical protein